MNVLLVLIYFYQIIILNQNLCPMATQNDKTFKYRVNLLVAEEILKICRQTDFMVIMLLVFEFLPKQAQPCHESRPQTAEWITKQNKVQERDE